MAEDEKKGAAEAEGKNKVVEVKDWGIFETRDAANEGVVLPLFLPTGEPTDQWLRIVGQESDRYREAWAELRGRAVDVAAIKDATERARAEDEEQLRVLSACVVGWSRPMECTRENVLALLRKASQLVRVLDRAIFDRTLFFGVRSSKLLDTRKGSSDSGESPKEAPSHSEPT